MSSIKDYTSAIAGLNEMNLEQLHEIYSQMLATAHDIGYKVPDDQLVETDDEEVLRTTIRALHPGILKFFAGTDKARVDAAAAKPAKPKKAKAAKPAAKKAKAAKPGKTPEAETSEESNVAKVATAKTAKKAAKKAPAKAAKKGKAAAANARTPVARTKYSEKATIKVLTKDKENPTRKGTGRFERVANLIKHDGKLVSDYLKKGKGSTLKFAVDAGWVKVVG